MPRSVSPHDEPACDVSWGARFDGSPDSGASIVERWQASMTTPVLETHDQIGGMFIIEAKSLYEALQVASKHPAAMLGDKVGWGIEVRPIEFVEEYTVVPAT